MQMSGMQRVMREANRLPALNDPLLRVDHAIASGIVDPPPRTRDGYVSVVSCGNIGIAETQDYRNQPTHKHSV
jgi:hypothetical protein